MDRMVEQTALDGNVMLTRSSRSSRPARRGLVGAREAQCEDRCRAAQPAALVSRSGRLEAQPESASDEFPLRARRSDQWTSTLADGLACAAARRAPSLDADIARPSRTTDRTTRAHLPRLASRDRAHPESRAPLTATAHRGAPGDLTADLPSGERRCRREVRCSGCLAVRILRLPDGSSLVSLGRERHV